MSSSESDSTARRVAGRAARVPTPAIFLASVVIGLLLLWSQGTMGDVVDAVRAANGWGILAGALLYLAGLWLLAVRWHLLVRMVRGASDLPRAAEAFLTSVVINYAAPIGLAVPSRAALTKRALGLNAAETGAVALWEIAADTATLGLGVLIWIAIGGWNGEVMPHLSPTARLIGVIVIAGGILLALVTAALLLRGRPDRRAKARDLLREIVVFPLRRPGAAAIALAVTAIYWAEQVLVIWVLMRALGVDPTAKLALGVIALPVLVGMLSPVPGGAGIREALMIAIARVAGVSTAGVLLAALIYRFALFASIPPLYGVVRLWIARRGSRGTMVTDSAATESGEDAAS